MSKKSAPARNQKVAKSRTNGYSFSQFSIADLAIVLLYAMVELWPRFDAVDVMGSQWLYLSVLNIVVSFYIISKKKLIENQFFKSLPFISIAGFIIISLASFAVAYNVIESMVTYSRIVIAFIAFLNLYAVIRSNPNILSSAIILLALMVMIQSLIVIGTFFSLTNSNMTLDQMILSLSGNTGNKNFLGVSILLKIPFLVLAFQRKEIFLKYTSAIGIFISCLALFIINSRSTYIGLFLEAIIFLGVTAYQFISKKERAMFMSPLVLIVMILISFGLTQAIFSKLEKEKTAGSYGAVAERLESISLSNEGSSGRIRLYQSALDFISHHPILGGGYGNWKINSIPYEKTTIRGFGIRKHVHNDYLETTADTGLAGGLLYTLFLVSIIIASAKILLSKAYSDEKKMLVLVLLMSHAAYMSDSLFNFPMERPNLFMVMLFNAASVLAIYFSGKTKQDSSVSNFMNQYAGYGLIFISVVTVYISMQCYRSMAVQNKVYMEWFGMPKAANPPFKSSDVNPYFPSFPNLNELGMPIANMKAKYLAQEGNYDEALAVLNADKNSNPYLYFTEFTKINIAIARQQMDTAYYWAKIAYYNRPANQQLYNLLYDIANGLKDTIEMQKVFSVKTSTRPEASDYYGHSQSMYVINKNFNQRIATIEDGLKKFSKDSTLNFQKHFVQGLILGNELKYAESAVEYEQALKYQNSPFANQNLGFAYFNTSKFNEAIPYLTTAINSNQFRDGRTEYIRGRCFFQLNQTDKACIDFKKATSMGYPVEMQMMMLCK